jgi:hypothetical protein
MKNDFLVEIARDVNGIAFTAFGKTLAQMGQKLAPRTPPNLPTVLIDELRQGNPSPNSVLDATNRVSQWVLGNDLHPYLNAAILGPSGEPLRLIFSIENELRRHADLGDVLADIPLELLLLPGDIVPLVLSPKIAAFIHLLDKLPCAQTSITQRNPPLRVLMVHSNPQELGGAVPDPFQIRQEILQSGQHLGSGLVEVDVLSRKTGNGVKGLPTREGLWEQLRDVSRSYDILVYLGHGDRAQSREDLPPLGLLYLETTNGVAGDPVTADILAGELYNNPVPVVLLMGCLTAADLPTGLGTQILARMPKAMRGNQGVAQALVNSSSGVQIAIGMRSKLESDDARHFLQAFFESLLHDKPGNIEAAVHAGRRKLHAVSPYYASWSAPMMFRVLSDEPMFDFLASPPAITIDAKDQGYRTLFWNWLAGRSLSKDMPEPITSLTQGLKDLETQLKQTIQTRAPLLMPEWQIGLRDQTIKLPIQLYGQLNVDKLEGNLVVDGEGISIVKVESSPELRIGYLLYPAIDGSQVHFRIERKSAGSGPLPQGLLMDAFLKLGSATSVRYPVNLSELKSHPHSMVCPGNSVVIVPAP